MYKKRTVLILLILVFLIQSYFSSGLTCEFTTSCNGTDVYHISSLNQSYAELSSSSFYDYSLCCDEPTDNLTATCDANSVILFTLSNTTNGFAELNSEDNYAFDVCLDAEDGLVQCDYVNDCTGYDSCLGSLSSSDGINNVSELLLGDCTANPYVTKICCNYLAGNGTACLVNDDCASGYCRTDYNDSLDYCAADSNDCVHEGISYGNGIVIDLRWTCNNGVWDEDITPPNTLTISDVEQNTLPVNGFYWDTNDNNQTSMTLISAEEVSCRISSDDLIYSNMINYSECSFNSINDIQCLIPSLIEGTYVYHVSCKDLAGNEQSTSQNTDINFTINFTEAFNASNSAPVVSDIFINVEVKKHQIMRIYCNGSDPDGTLLRDLDATIYLRTAELNIFSWNRLDAVTMLFDGNNHYYDYQIIDDSGTLFDARCVLDDGELNGVRDEFKFEDKGKFVEIIDDWDNDGIPDAIDMIEGDLSGIETNFDNFQVKFDGVVALPTTVGEKIIGFVDNGNTIVEFSHNFTKSDFNFDNINLIIAGDLESKSYVIVKGLNLLNETKTIYLDKVIYSNMICVKDAEVNDIGDVTFACNGQDEYLFDNCGVSSQTINGITCTDIGDYYKIEGLRHSAVTEFSNTGLYIYSDDDYGITLPAEHINFYADYYNVTSDLGIPDADCKIWFNDSGWNNMSAIDDKYTYGRAFSSEGAYVYNVSCSADNYSTLMLQDSIYVEYDPNVVPEFNGNSLLFALLSVSVGIVVIRKNN